MTVDSNDSDSSDSDSSDIEVYSEKSADIKARTMHTMLEEKLRDEALRKCRILKNPP